MQVNIKRRLWMRLSDLILEEKLHRMSCLDAIARTMDAEVFKEYLEFLDHSRLSGTAVVMKLW